jgi:hypothetical protein
VAKLAARLNRLTLLERKAAEAGLRNRHRPVALAVGRVCDARSKGRT